MESTISYGYPYASARIQTGTNCSENKSTPNREVVYAAARKANPSRWSGSTRNWNPIDEVHLNPITAPRKEAATTLKAA